MADLISQEQRRKSFEAIRSFWRIGDLLIELRQATPAKGWRQVLRECAGIVGTNAASLYEAVRASDAFPSCHRESLLRRFDEASLLISVSHVIELARAAPRRRSRAIQSLLSARRSVRELRAHLREPG